VRERLATELQAAGIAVETFGGSDGLRDPENIQCVREA